MGVINKLLGKGSKIAEEAEEAVSGSAKKSGGNDFDGWLKNKYNSQQKKYDDLINQGEEQARAVADRLGVKHEGLSYDEVIKETSAANRQRATEKQMNPDIFDKAQYHKVPQAALGIGITGGLLFSMHQNKGQQSNSQLYNQQQ